MSLGLLSSTLILIQLSVHFRSIQCTNSSNASTGGPVVAALDSGGCVHPQIYWRSQNSSTFTMCGLSWSSLMQREVALTAIPANVYWIAGFHCYAPVALASPQNQPDDVTRALLIARDSLERACTNVSGWPGQDDRTVVYDALDTLYRYTMINACVDDYTAPSDALLQAFYQTATPDLIIVPAQSLPVNGSVVALVYSLLTDTYRFRQFVVSSAVIGFTLIPILICIIVCIADRRRRFFAQDKDRHKHDANKPFLDATDNTADGSLIELSDRSSCSSGKRSVSNRSLSDSIV